MKRKLSILLTLLLVLTSVFSYSLSAFGAEVDTASSASVAAEMPAANPPATTSAVSSAAQVHIVTSGDMMWKIAKKYGLTLKELLALNPQIKNPNMIYAGQKIAVKASAPSAAAPAPVAVKTDGKVYQGMGKAVNFRVGPGEDSEGVPVYSINYVYAFAKFDASGKVLDAYIDALEVTTPNYDGAGMPHLSGWPNTPGYNVSDHNTGLVTGLSENTVENITAEVNAWKSKRERCADGEYHMNDQMNWDKQLDHFQNFFVGKNITEIKDWFAKNTTAAGRPIKVSTTKQDELDKLAKLSDGQKAVLADVVSGATMSMSDAHGDFIGALEDAYNNRIEVK